MSFDSYNRPRMGGARIGPGSPSPFVKVMLITNGAVFLLQKLVGVQFDLLFSLVPQLFFDQFPNYLYQVFTYMFLHGGLLHLLFNMFMLWMFGTEIEYAWGSKVFGRFYILCGLAGGVLSLAGYVVAPAGLVGSLGASGIIMGASGAIYGVFIAYWLMFPNRLLYLYFLVPVRVKWAIPGFMLFGFLFGGGGVAHLAHLGGALWGFIHLKVERRGGSLGRVIKGLRYKRQSAKLNRNRRQAEDIMKRVDAILDKINEVGIENISKDDRKFLEDASSELSRRKGTQEPHE